MRAIEYDHYGGPEVVQIRECPRPEPRRGELLVRVHAAALNPKDILVRAGKFPALSGRRFPKRMGYDWAGEVVRAGRGVSLREGTALFGMINSWSAGALAEYAIVRVEECAPKPASSSWEEAASIPLAALTALQALRDHGRLEAGQRVLINGASGGVGVYAVQIAKALGAHVTTLTSAGNRALVSSLGADLALDYAVARVEEHAPFDVIFDVFGNRNFAAARPWLFAKGTYVTTVPKPRAFVDHVLTQFAAQRGRLVVVKSRAADLSLIARWVEQGVLRPVVDRVYALPEIVEAQRHLASKRARGKIVLRV